ncbi:MAG: magnesium chelatase domain-containing protein [Collinsella sp.]
MAFRHPDARHSEYGGDESRGRIRRAMRSAGFEIPRSGITVNLAPGDIRKTGSGFDLPIAIAALAADELQTSVTTSIAALSQVSLVWTVPVLPSRARWRFSYWLATWGCLLSPAGPTSMCHSRA